jgi:hypothetical protein
VGLLFSAWYTLVTYSIGCVEVYQLKASPPSKQGESNLIKSRIRHLERNLLWTVWLWMGGCFIIFVTAAFGFMILQDPTAKQTSMGVV